jgi:acylphosphatase
MSAAVHIFARGRVQGVWFRAGTQDQALQLGVYGWARNCPDGSVEIHAEGEKDTLERFVSWCRKGTPASQVSALDIEWVSPQGLDSFEIRH